jgi:hypothetical protein
MNDFRKCELFDDELIGAVRKYLNEEEQIRFSMCIQKLPYEFIHETLYNYLKNKCIQIKF